MHCWLSRGGLCGEALLRLLQESGIWASEVPQEMRGSLFSKEEARFDLPGVLLRQREDRQGIWAVGESEYLWPILRLLQERLQDAVIVRLESLEEEGRLRASVELPGRAKEVLDRVRSTLRPTLRNHHRLILLDPDRVHRAETRLADRPDLGAEVEDELYHELILNPLRETARARIEHVSLSGRRVRPREAQILEAHKGHLVLRRRLSRGRLNGLNLPIEEGDYAITMVWEGQWHFQHTYYRRDGSPIGEYYNVNTPVEFYPWGIRYVDLEVDVVRRAEEVPVLTDRDRLSILVQQGFVHPGLEEKAIRTSHELMQALS